MTLLLKIIRDLKLFEGDDEKFKKLLSIHENDDTMLYQRHIHIVLENIDI